MLLFVIITKFNFSPKIKYGLIIIFGIVNERTDLYGYHKFFCH